jgi:hypothetical protein
LKKCKKHDQRSQLPTNCLSPLNAFLPPQAKFLGRFRGNFGRGWERERPQEKSTAERQKAPAYRAKVIAARKITQTASIAIVAPRSRRRHAGISTGCGTLGFGGMRCFIIG